MKKFGPLSQMQLSKITAILDAHQSSYKISVSKNQIDLAHSKIASRQPTQYPTYSGPIEYLFIEIDEADIKLVKAELEKLALNEGPSFQVQIEGISRAPSPRAIRKLYRAFFLIVLGIMLFFLVLILFFKQN